MKPEHSEVPLAKQVNDQMEVNMLLAEDDETSRTIIEKVAARNGWQFTHADNGKEAVTIFKQKRFDIVLMDVQMPVLKWIKKQ